MKRANSLKIHRFLEKSQQEMSTFLKQLVEMETPSKEAGKQQVIFEFFQQEFKDLGYYSFRMPGKLTGGYLMARPQSRKKFHPLQLLVGHCDTVWPLGTLQKMPITQQNGILKGPGVYDMKAGLTQIIFALKAIKVLNLELPVSPVVLINADEEIGSRESTSAIVRLAKIADRAFVLEPPLGLSGKLKTGRKGLARFIITVEGKAAHAGLNPEQGINAIVELSYQVQQLFKMNNPQKGISVNVGMIEGGMAANVVAPSSKATVDVRVLNSKDAEEISQQILNLKPTQEGIKITITGGFGRPPMEQTPQNQQLWKLAKGIGHQIGLQLEQAVAGGGSDGNTTSLYTATLDGLGTVGDGAHASHEFIFLNKMVERTSLLTLLLLLPPLGSKADG